MYCILYNVLLVINNDMYVVGDFYRDMKFVWIIY